MVSTNTGGSEAWLEVVVSIRSDKVGSVLGNVVVLMSAGVAGMVARLLSRICSRVGRGRVVLCPPVLCDREEDGGGPEGGPGRNILERDPCWNRRELLRSVPTARS